MNLKSSCYVAFKNLRPIGAKKYNTCTNTTHAQSILNQDSNQKHERINKVLITDTFVFFLHF